MYILVYKDVYMLYVLRYTRGGVSAVYLCARDGVAWLHCL